MTDEERDALLVATADGVRQLLAYRVEHDAMAPVVSDVRRQRLAAMSDAQARITRLLEFEAPAVTPPPD